MARSLIGIVTLAAAILGAALAHAATPPSSLPALVATRTTAAPTIDGALDDEAWRGGPQPTGEWRSYNPLNGDTIPQQTRVWIAYDDRYLYFAFQCDDQEPDRIKASVARRDTIFSDDWVGLSLDALGSGQVSYHMMVNPSRRADGHAEQRVELRGSVARLGWDSAGTRTPTDTPWRSACRCRRIRFKGGDSVRMGVLFWRRISRSGVSVAWPAMKPDSGCSSMHAPLIFGHLRVQAGPRGHSLGDVQPHALAEETPVRSGALRRHRRRQV